jgi:predicted naringenin-chalcone synthase
LLSLTTIAYTLPREKPDVVLLFLACLLGVAIDCVTMTNSANPHLVLKAAASVTLLWVGYTTLIFPGRRVLNWFEICTDGFSPDWLASDAQDVVGSHWKEAKRRGFLNEIGDAIVDHLSDWGGGDILEMAAGSGNAPAVWHDLLFQEKGLCTRTILTDIQPKTPTWEILRNKRSKKRLADSDDSDEEEWSLSPERESFFSFECGTFTYVASSVDATQAHSAVQDLIPKWASDGKEIRMIHLSLHHFDPNLVHQILQDATRANAAILIVDHSPNTGGALYNGALAFRQLIKRLPSILMRNPIKILLAPVFPAIVVGLWHDATVSILRSYSQAELRQMLHATEEGKAYNIQMFRSAGYGEWLGLPAFVRRLLPGMNDEVMNFVFATPPPSSPAPPFIKSQHLIAGSRINDTVKEPSRVYGMPVMPDDSPPVSAGMQVALLLLIGIVSYKTLLDDENKIGKKKERKQYVKSSTLGYSGLIGKPAILGVGTANPPHKWTFEQGMAGMEWKRQQIDLDEDFCNFMRRMNANSGVESRYFGDPHPDAERIAAGISPEGLYGGEGMPTVSERHAYWAKWAPRMAIDAATKAVKSWGGNKKNITHVVFHSCTGFKAPGVELDVIDALKLTGVRRRLGINYMGCFGGFTGMSVAKAFCEADPTAVVLVVCAETCYAHIAISENRSKSIGNSFFADGAAAAVIGAGRPGDWALCDQQTKTLGTETRELMTWRPSDFNYDMYLDKGIGYKFGMHLYWNLKSYLTGLCKESVHDIEWVVHPGGKGILDFFCSEKLNLGITKNTLRHSYDVLRRYGNMSSGTIFFVLQELFKESKEHPTEVKPIAVCFGFGPGLTLEIAELRRIGSEETNGQHL